MKTSLNIRVSMTFYLSLVIALVSCSRAEVSKESEIAQQYAQQFLEEKIGTIVPGEGSINGYKHSDLYILTPEDESKVVEIEGPGNDESKFAEFAMQIANSFVGLAIDGCNRACIEGIIYNDRNYKEWETGAKDYIMVSFVSVQGVKDESLKEIGICFRFSKDMNIINTYSVKEEDEDYVYTRLFGQTTGRYYGAVDCQYDYLERMYDNYVETLKDDNLSIDFRYGYIKVLNDLFEYERFKYTDNRSICLESCLEQLNEYEDKKVLKDRAYAKIKSF